jgi:hypothetical protein
MIEFTNNDPHPTETKCDCGSIIMETINDESPAGMSALNDGYDYQCHWCRKLVKKDC